MDIRVINTTKDAYYEYLFRSINLIIISAIVRKISYRERFGNFKDNFFFKRDNKIRLLDTILCIVLCLLLMKVILRYRNADKALLILNYRVIVRLKGFTMERYTYFSFFISTDVRMTRSLK